MPSLITIKNLADRNKAIDEVLKSRKVLKDKISDHRQHNAEFRDSSEKFLEPITRELKSDSTEIQKDIKTLSNQINQLTNKPSSEVQLKLPKLQKTITVSSTIADYLSRKSDRSKAPYSLRYNKENDKYQIGNSEVDFQYDKIKINNTLGSGDPTKLFIATPGLMELLTKNNPNQNVYTEDDKNQYKQILLDTNAIWLGFNRSNSKIKYNPSSTYRLITEQILPELWNGNQIGRGLGYEFMTSDPNSLIDTLYLSMESIKAGNSSISEHNKVYAILDELLRLKIINKTDYLRVVRQITFSS